MGLTLTESKRDILKEIDDGTRHGYALSKELGVRCSTIYQHLDELEEHGYVVSEMDEESNRRLYELTEKSQTILEAYEGDT